MSKTVDDVADEILESVLASPKKQRRLYSKTFWGRFGYKTRTRERVEQVAIAMKQRSLVISLDGELGKEDREDWLVRTFVATNPLPGEPPQPGTDAVPTPNDRWFTTMETRSFESEREVEYFFVMPLLQQFGYVEDDFAIGLPVTMFEGVKKVKKQADFVVFDGPDRGHAAGNALMVIEAKRAGWPITEDVLGQAKAYAIWLATPYYLATNGNDICVYLFRGALLPDVPLMSFMRSELQMQWPALYQTLNRQAVLEYKRQLLATMPANPMQPV